MWLQMCTSRGLICRMMVCSDKPAGRAGDAMNQRARSWQTVGTQLRGGTAGASRRLLQVGTAAGAGAGSFIMIPIPIIVNLVLLPPYGHRRGGSIN